MPRGIHGILQAWQLGSMRRSRASFSQWRPCCRGTGRAGTIFPYSKKTVFISRGSGGFVISVVFQEE